MADLNKLHPYVKQLSEKLIDQCKKQGLKVIITQALRTNEEQNELYAQGRTKPGNIVTNAKGGQSMHNYGLAIDFAPVVNGNIPWNDIALFKKIGTIGLQVGFDSYGGNWTSFKDYPHLQWTGGLTLKDLQSGKRPEAPKEDDFIMNEMSFVVDGKPVKLENALKDGTTYVKLRDICNLLKVNINKVEGNKITLSTKKG